MVVLNQRSAEARSGARDSDDPTFSKHVYADLLTGRYDCLVRMAVLRNKALRPVLVALQELRPSRGAHNPQPLDAHYDTIRTAMRGVFQELGLPHEHRQLFYRASPLSD